jgi:hypothetical protein
MSHTTPCAICGRPVALPRAHSPYEVEVRHRLAKLLRCDRCTPPREAATVDQSHTQKASTQDVCRRPYAD